MKRVREGRNEERRMKGVKEERNEEGEGAEVGRGEVRGEEGIGRDTNYF